MGSLSINNSVTNISRLGTFKRVVYYILLLEPWFEISREYEKTISTIKLYLPSGSFQNKCQDLPNFGEEEYFFRLDSDLAGRSLGWNRGRLRT
jgi:hypothetical protein